MQLNDGSIQATGSDEGNRRDMQQGCKIVPGTGDIPSLGESLTLRPIPIIGQIPKLGRMTEIQIHSKTIRTLCAKFPGLHANIIEVISIIELYLELHNKHHDRAQDIINWSGSRRNWVRKQHKAITDGIRAGYIEQYKEMILLSPKAERVLNLYDGIFEESERNYKAKAEAVKTKPKGKRRNTRRPGEPQKL